MVYVGLETLCVCGHAFGEHRKRAPHGCTDAHLTRAGHACACEAFRLPNREPRPGMEMCDRSASEHAEHAAATLAYEGALRSLVGVTLPGDGFGSLLS